MNKKEALQIVMAIESYYCNSLTKRDNPFSQATTAEEKIVELTNFYHRALKDFEFEKVMDNLVAYSQENEYPPKISNLVKGLNNKEFSPYIPGVEETRAMLEKRRQEVEENKKNAPTKEYRHELLRKHMGEEFYQSYMKRIGEPVE